MTPAKVVLVTGASSGIGRFTARHLGAARLAVFGGVRRPEAIGGLPGVEPLRLDVTDDASVSAAVDAIVERTGRIDGLVNNAGGSVLGRQRRSRSSRRARCWTSTCWGLADVAGRASRHAPAGLGPHRQHQLGGRVSARPFMAIYAASKHAVEGLSGRWITRCVSSGFGSCSSSRASPAPTSMRQRPGRTTRSATTTRRGNE